jgi:hypothetical protein
MEHADEIVDVPFPPGHEPSAVVQVEWALKGFGRVPDDFEQWIEPILTEFQLRPDKGICRLSSDQSLLESGTREGTWFFRPLRE